MARPIALGAEFFGTFHKPFAEEALPIAIYCHARGERMLPGDEPTREAEAVAGGVLGHPLAAHQSGATVVAGARVDAVYTDGHRGWRERRL